MSIVHQVILTLIQLVVQLTIVGYAIQIRLFSALETARALLWDLLMRMLPPRNYHVRKLPRHLGISVCETTVDVGKVGQIVLCAISAGIDRISVYDPCGTLKANRERLTQTLNDGVAGLDVDCLLIDQPCLVDKHRVEGEGPVDKQWRIVNLSILCMQDGIESLVDVARQLCRDDTIGQSVSITPKLMSDRLAQRCVEEVDCLLKFGLADSTCGYPPWCLRVTEIIPCVTHRRFGDVEMIEALDAFSRRDQRFGK